MRNRTKYQGITLGPIYDTMLLTSTPAGLWASSFLFSYIAKRICEELVNEGVKLEDFLVPYFELTTDNKTLFPIYKNADVKIDCNVLFNTGVGLFHDRIIFSGGSIEKTQHIIDKVINEIACKFCYDLTGNYEKLDEYQAYFKQYLQIYAIELENDNPPIGQLSRYLDAIELQKNFVIIETNNYILELFNNAKIKEERVMEGKNEQIKNSFLVKSLVCGWQLLDKNNNIKSIDYIANARKVPQDTKKCIHYYAVIHADIDGLGQALFEIEDINNIKEFSKNNLEFIALASKQIQDFGGVTIYGGGDDLLFLTPLESLNNKNILDLLNSIKEALIQVFPERTISFGVSMQYKKYPLYEALASAKGLLNEEAKKNKNALALNLNKHSGQSIGFVIENFSSNNITSYISNMIKKCSDEDFLKSALYHIHNQKELFMIGWKNNRIHNLFINVFDNSEQKKWTGYLSQVEELILHEGLKDFRLSERQDNSDDKTNIDYTLAILKLIKFFTEKGGGLDEDIN